MLFFTLGSYLSELCDGLELSIEIPSPDQDVLLYRQV